MSPKRRPTPLDAATAALARRPRTEFEMRAYLRQRRYEEAEIEQAVARLSELGYLDDGLYAAHIAGKVAQDRAWGPGRVRNELARRGVRSEIIDSALAAASEEGVSPAGNIQRALAKMVRPRGLPADRKGRDRIRAALARRGFDQASILEAIEALGPASGEDDLEQP
jgi:regulatory protein